MAEADDPDEFWYPTVENVITIHEDIIDEDPDADHGVEEPDRIQYAIDYVAQGHFGQLPTSIHGKAFHLMRLIAANHWFVDGNKRTALATTALFYYFNGYRFEIGEDVRSMLKLFSVRETLIDRNAGIEYFADRSRPLDWDDLEELDSLTLAAMAILPPDPSDHNG